jgi:hypothetical protein
MLNGIPDDVIKEVLPRKVKIEGRKTVCCVDFGERIF